MTLRLEQIYQDVILDHYKHPQHRGLREPFGAQVFHVNPVCGDEVTLRVTLADDGETVADISYDGQGCSISQASTSVLTQQVIGQSVGAALKTVTAFTEMVSSRGNVEGDEDVLGDGIAFAGVAKYPARVKCALLGWMAFKDALAQASADKHAPRIGRCGNDFEEATGMSETSAPDDELLFDLEEATRDVVDPELGINVVDLGLVYGLNVEAGDEGTVALIDMTLTSAACPLTDVIEDQSRTALVGAGLVSDLKLNWVWNPPWGPDKITEAGREQLRALGFTV